jgi:hypothetical protein
MQDTLVKEMADNIDGARQSLYKFVPIVKDHKEEIGFVGLRPTHQKNSLIFSFMLDFLNKQDIQGIIQRAFKHFNGTEQDYLEYIKNLFLEDSVNLINKNQHYAKPLIDALKDDIFGRITTLLAYILTCYLNKVLHEYVSGKVVDYLCKEEYISDVATQTFFKWLEIDLLKEKKSECITEKKLVENEHIFRFNKRLRNYFFKYICHDCHIKFRFKKMNIVSLLEYLGIIDSFELYFKGDALEFSMNEDNRRNRMSRKRKRDEIELISPEQNAKEGPSSQELIENEIKKKIKQLKKRRKPHSKEGPILTPKSIKVNC